MTEQPQPVVHPLDIVQITDQAHKWHGVVAVVDEVRGWGVTIDVSIPRNDGKPADTAPNRIKFGQFVVVGRAVVSVEAKILARRQSQETYAALAVEQGRFPVGDLIDDAERWRSLMGCARFRVMGSAGFSPPHPEGRRHMGVEFWTTHPERTDPAAMGTVLAFIDAARFVAAPKPDPA